VLAASYNTSDATTGSHILWSIKSNYNAECDKFMLCNAGRRIGQFDLAALFGAAYVRTASVEKAVSGFKSTGIWPFNPDVFTHGDFLPSMVTDEAQPTTSGTAPLVILVFKFLFHILF